MIDDQCQPDGGGADHDEQPVDEAMSEYLLPSALISPGLLHVCLNMAAEVDSSLSWWSEWLPGFKALTYLLHHDHLRQ
eukprot:11057507-Heterocapsa_arctica.AAC.1